MEALTDGVKPITELVLHYKELAIEEESVSVDVAGRGVEIQGFGNDLDREFFIIYLVAPINAGEIVRIALQFTSALRDDIMVGFYRSSYLDTVTNTTRWERSILKIRLSSDGSLPRILSRLTLAVLSPVLVNTFGQSKFSVMFYCDQMNQPSRPSSIFVLGGYQ